MKTIKIKLLKKALGLEPGEILKLEVDDEGTPLDQVWRRVLRNAEIDGSVEIVKEKRKTSKKKTTNTENSPSEELENDDS